MQAHANAWVSEKRSNEGTISFLIRFFDDVVEVPYRLVRMDYESKRDFIQGVNPSREGTKAYQDLNDIDTV